MSAVWEHHLKYWSKEPASEVGLRVAELLDAWQGLHHFEERAMKRVDWAHPYFIALTMRASLSTFDFDYLTTLVLLAHDHCIRIEIQPCNASHLRFLFHQRKGRVGSMCERHPTIEQTVEAWRKRGHASKTFEQPLAAEAGAA